MATAASMPDMKVSDPGSLTVLAGNSSTNAARQNTIERANRSTTRVAGTPQAATLQIWLLPMANYTISSPFGDAGSLSKGVDLAAPEGTPFYAAHSGTVTLARWNGAYGYTVMVDAGNGVQIVYGHASRLLVKEGQKVNAGDLLGLSGNTGYTWGPSVHFEIRVNGVAQNAITFLNDQYVNLVQHKDSLS
jgi:murein DD-endopeptidase MepM/ murein hydrolase activator NlpD